MELRQEGSTAVIRVHGSADMNDADKMRQMLEDLSDRKTTPIVLDLSDMDFICSAGLGAIISAHLKSRDYKGQILLVSPQKSVRDLLETTRLTKLFPIFDSVPQALEH